MNYWSIFALACTAILFVIDPYFAAALKDKVAGKNPASYKRLFHHTLILLAMQVVYYFVVSVGTHGYLVGTECTTGLCGLAFLLTNGPLLLLGIFSLPVVILLARRLYGLAELKNRN